MRGKITKTSLEALQRQVSASGKSVLIYDTQLRGFGARVASGGISFFVEYRLGGRGGRNRRMTIGRLGEMTAEEARRKAIRLRADITDGVDVLQQRQDARRKLAGASYDEIVDRYLDLNAKPGRYWAEVRRLLTSADMRPIRKRALATIARSELVAIIDDVSRRSPSAARALFAALRPFFSWCVPRGLIEASPLADVKPPAPVAARDRILSPLEVRVFWQATDALGFPFKAIFRLLLLTGQRRREVAELTWSELDLANGVWTIPGARAKNAKPHVVDLSPQALAVIDELTEGEPDALVFTTTGRTPPSGFSKVKARLDKAMRMQLEGGLPAWRTHDLRRTAASGMAALNVPPHVVERVLNHLSGAQGGLVGVYQRHEYRDERRQALITWGSEVERIVEGRSLGDNVVAFPRG